VANGVVYVGSDDFNVYALNAKTGAKRLDDLQQSLRERQ
jgi:outer membrane protein assembly factor BamB